MKKFSGRVKEQFQKLGRGGDPGPAAGSSEAPPTLPVHPSVTNFVDKINALVTGTGSTGTGDKHIRDLAGTIGPAIFSVAIEGAELPNEVQNFWVGAHNEPEWDQNEPGSAQDKTGTCNKVRFTSIEVRVYDPKVKIPLAVAVLTTKADKLDISESNGELESFRFKREYYTSVDLETYPSTCCLFVLTTQLSGCSFVIGCRGTWLYMGHAQKVEGTVFAHDSEEVAKNLKLKRKTMFQGLENQLDSTFLVVAGSEFKIELDGIITYNPRDHNVNVIGLVCNRKFYCILATKDRSKEKINDVALVTLETDGKWKTEKMPKTW